MPFVARSLAMPRIGLGLQGFLCLWLCGLACGCGEERAPVPRHAGLAQTANPDHVIFDVVLSDLLGNSEFYPGVNKSQIAIRDVTCGGPLNSFGDIGPEVVPRDLIEDVERRNPHNKSYSIRDYHSKLDNVLVLNERQYRRLLKFEDAPEYRNVKGYIVPVLPGYSRDGRSALFRFTLGPTDHIAGGYYRLEKGGMNGDWKIVKKFLYFGS